MIFSIQPKRKPGNFLAIKSIPVKCYFNEKSRVIEKILNGKYQLFNSETLATHFKDYCLAFIEIA